MITRRFFPFREREKPQGLDLRGPCSALVLLTLERGYCQRKARLSSQRERLPIITTRQRRKACQQPRLQSPPALGRSSGGCPRLTIT
ncbi:hypothetical protein SKAU_G00080560 [Synaphobranchus kaupii]|uniref:Uncharacterized protein n=1 Tax=Synaphobranchus kaupii TaxID=118154 RepID=A0A9Q1J5J9_SYNKA|nr:hypothetical protein SKAU_G00080560 [Synaphobranchus kaupii]